jgi:Fur family peroxide stress response transcriptional regulator
VDAALAEVNQRLSARLREAGLRVTLPRVTVLGTLERMHGHCSADDVLAALRTGGVDLGRASVYNIMNDFVRTGLVMVADVGPGRTLYELTNDWHAHFVCTDCGKVFDVPAAELPDPGKLRSACGFETREVQINFKGPCPENGKCQGKQTEAPTA